MEQRLMRCISGIEPALSAALAAVVLLMLAPSSITAASISTVAFGVTTLVLAPHR